MGGKTQCPRMLHDVFCHRNVRVRVCVCVVSISLSSVLIDAKKDADERV